MSERRDPDIVTAQRPDPVNNPPGNRPLSTSDLAAPDRPAQTSAMAQPSGDQAAPLFAADRAQDYRTRWDSIQTGFVDEPRRAVEQADTLVAEVIQQLAKSFADERTKLEQQLGHGDSTSTEDLRQALRRYRSFFDRLLTV